MRTNLRKIFILLFLFLGLAGLLVYGRHQVYFSKGANLEGAAFVVEKGDNFMDVASKLSAQKLISQRAYFVYYLWRSSMLHTIKAGKYKLPPGASIPEIALIITSPKLGANEVEVMFQEGLTFAAMAERLNENGLPGKDFSALAKDPPAELKNKFAFLAELPQGATLEGYLFPDTYSFAKNSPAQLIAEKMLENFGQKMTGAKGEEIKKQGKNLFQIVTMASIVEKEAGHAEDMGLVSSVFWNRLKIGQRLQSDATLEYVLGGNKIKHSIEETQFKSSYNTYQVAGLPPGPVANPGLDAIEAAINPTPSGYFYFLTDLATGKTVFAKTFEEHVVNKAKFGL